MSGIVEPRRQSKDAQERWIEGRFQTNDDRFGNSKSLGYRLYLPANPRGRPLVPLLVMLHGCEQNSRVFAEGTRMNGVAGQHGFAVLYPEQSRAANLMRCWNWFDPVSLTGDGEAAAIARLIDDIASLHAIDRTRIYVAGMSAGGAMARILAVCYSNMFAACAVHSGVMYKAATTVMQALATLRSGSRASPEAVLTVPEDGSGLSPDFVPTLVIHGDRDNSVNPINAAQIVRQCRALASSNVHTLALTLSGPHEQQASSGGRRYVMRDYVREGRVWIRDINIHGLGHAWSGGDARHPFNDPAGPCASELIREFVILHRRDSVVKSASPHADTLDERDFADAHSSRRKQRFAGWLHELLRTLRRRL